MSWGTEYDTACNAADTYRDPRTAEQRKWDKRAMVVADYFKRGHILTGGPDPISWSRNPKLRERVTEFLKDALREMQALDIEGYREGDPVGPIPEVKPIASKVIKCATMDQVQPKVGA